jgi:hypothetical protein
VGWGFLFAYWFIVDRHGLRPRDDKVRGNECNGWFGYIAIFVIARRERSEGRGNPSCLGRRGLVCLFGFWFTVDRHGLRPRDYKVRGSDVDGSVTTRSLSLRGENGVSDAAIHRVSRGTVDLSLRLLVHSGSPRAYALAMTRVVINGSEHNIVIAKEERKRGTRQSIVSWGTRMGLSFRLLVYSGSPRAFSPRDDKGE